VSTSTAICNARRKLGPMVSCTLSTSIKSESNGRTNVRTGTRIHELPRDADAPSLFAHAALPEVSKPSAARRWQGPRSYLELEGRCAAHDLQARHLGQPIEHLLGDPSAKYSGPSYSLMSVNGRTAIDLSLMTAEGASSPAHSTLFRLPQTGRASRSRIYRRRSRSAPKQAQR